MPDETAALGRVTLARGLPRLLAIPAGLAVVALAAAAAGVVAWSIVGAGAGAVLIVVAIGLLAAALAALRVPLTTRLDVEAGRLTVAWLGGARHYELVRGAVTRVTLAGDDGRVIRSRTDLLGWTVGPALLRGEERIEAVRLAATPTMILVPTDHGRLAIAAASEAQLVAALSAAARVRQRMQEAVAVAPARLEPAGAERPAGEATEEPGAVSVLTGIERARREAELAAAREAALVAARAELAAQGAAPPVPTAVRRGEPEPWREREIPWSPPSAIRQRRRATWTRPDWATPRVLAVLTAVAWALVPLLAASGTWLVAQGVGPGSTTWNKMLTLALALGGPAAALAVLAVRAWWPRLTGLVTTTSVAALIMVARAVAG